MSESGTLLEQVEQSIKQRKLLPRGAVILVAVSGGMDSMVLLDLLARMASKHRWRLTIAHFNHQLRGRSSDADERLVQRTAAKLGLPFVAGRGDVRRFASNEKLSVEMAARNLRHAFLACEAAKRKIKVVALAHHADDQVELFFLRLLRGAGGVGLAGMKWQNPSPSNPNIRLVRPLLEQSKSTLAAYGRQMRVPFREDATNAQLDYQRNRIRHEVIPFLRKQQPALERVVLRQMELLGAEAELVTLAAKNWLEGKGPLPFEDLPVAVQRRCLQLQLADEGIFGEFDFVERLRLHPNKQFTVMLESKTVGVFRDDIGELRFGTLGQPVFTNERLEVHLEPRAGEVALGKTRIRWKKVRLRAGTFRAPKPIANCETFDAAKVGSDIVVRYWQPGDRFQPIGMEKSVKLQDILVNRKIPRTQRHELLVGTTSEGEIFWIEGVRIGERFKLDKNSVYGLNWRWKRVV